jgi:hypothetical protein
MVRGLRHCGLYLIEAHVSAFPLVFALAGSEDT